MTTEREKGLKKVNQLSRDIASYRAVLCDFHDLLQNRIKYAKGAMADEVFRVLLIVKGDLALTLKKYGLKR